MRRGERGSVLILVPVGFVVLMLLAAISVDSAVAYLGQRRLDDMLVSAANDAATAGLSDAAFYASGSIVLDRSATQAALCRSLAAQGGAGLEDLAVRVAVAGPVVSLEASARVPVVFGRVVPGWSSRPVSAAASAAAETAPGPPPTPTGQVWTPLVC